MFETLISYALAGVLFVLAFTAVIAIFRTLLEGVESFAAFDRAGFTFWNFLRGKIPANANDTGVMTGDSALIETYDGGIWAEETRTIAKHQA